MLLQHGHNVPTSLRRFEVKIVVSVSRAVVSRSLTGRDEMLDGGHEDVNGGVETFGDGVVEGGFELFLFADDGVEEVLLVDVGGLFKSSR
jgi:hypothetical protein